MATVAHVFKGEEPAIRPNTKGRPKSPSTRPPEGGWLLRAVDCPHKADRQLQKGNANAKWMVCKDCGSRWHRVSGDNDYLHHLGIALKMGDHKPINCTECNAKMTLHKCPMTNKRFWACTNFPKCRAFQKTMLDAEVMDEEEAVSTRRSHKGKSKSKTRSCCAAHSPVRCPEPKDVHKKREPPKSEDEMEWENAAPE